MQLEPSALYIVATPIGNLQDITLRAVDVLRSADHIISESPLGYNKIKQHFSLDKPLQTYRDENRHKMIPRILEYLEVGNSVALISDSGTPLISDPGFKLVQEVRRAGYKVIPIPGPSAVIAALSVSGLPTDRFAFIGFLPKKDNQSEEVIKEYGGLDATLVIYESPHRILKTLQKISETLGNRYVCVMKEMTKVFENAYCGNTDDLVVKLADANFKGEFVILVAKEGFNG